MTHFILLDALLFYHFLRFFYSSRIHFWVNLWQFICLFNFYESHRHRLRCTYVFDFILGGSRGFWFFHSRKLLLTCEDIHVLMVYVLTSLLFMNLYFMFVCMPSKHVLIYHGEWRYYMYTVISLYVVIFILTIVCDVFIVRYADI